MHKNYGVPYKGSKNMIAKEIVEALPPATHFYDLFAGGCAVTHAAIESGKYQHIHANDLDGTGLQLFCKAVNGDYRDECRWISREDFFRLKDTDPYVCLCWSFSNNGCSYLYGESVESRKKIMWDMLTPPTTTERYAAWLRPRPYLSEIMGSRHGSGVPSMEGLNRAQSMEGLNRVQSMEGLNRVQSMEGLNRDSFTATCKDYADAEILPDSVIYCDIPYRGRTGGAGAAYNTRSFDYDRFYAWCRRQTELVVVSEYSMPGGFVSVWERVKSVRSAAITTSYATEHLWVPEGQLPLWHSRQDQIRMEGYDGAEAL